MKTQQILFNDDMIRALLDGRETQTRRLVTPQPVFMPAGDGLPDSYFWAAKGADNPRSKNAGVYGDTSEMGDMAFRGMLEDACPYGRPGDLLWVRETHHLSHANAVTYRADFNYNPFSDDECGEDCSMVGEKWRPSIYMPRWASRLTLRITDVRVERVQDISEKDAIAEGVEVFNEDGNLWYSGWMDGKDSWFDENWKWHCNDPVQAYKELWDGINFKRGHGWATNPWVWVIEFEVIHKNIDQMLQELAA